MVESFNDTVPTSTPETSKIMTKLTDLSDNTNFFSKQVNVGPKLNVHMFVNYDKLDLQGNPLKKNKATSEINEESKEEVSSFADSAAQDQPKAYVSSADDSSDVTTDEG